VNATTLTTIVGLIITAVGTIGWPVWVNRRKSKGAFDTRQSLDSQSVATMFKDERDRLQIRLDAAAVAHAAEMRAYQAESQRALAAAEATWRAQHERDQAQIAELRDELYGLYRQLGRQQPGK
jgi:hypothetical protein